jgi:aminomethyltransferase
MKKTALFAEHEKQQGKMVDFFGWALPVHYGSLIEEHHAVRQDAGMFDVSHMTVIDITGDDAGFFLWRLLANDIEKLVDGKALYTCMLNEMGGVIDDLMVYRVRENTYRLIFNAATIDNVLDWLETKSVPHHCDILRHDQLSIVAVQGPHAREKALSCLPPEHQSDARDLKPFHTLFKDTWQIARTGYTGEDGFEFILPHADAINLWSALLAKDVKPCGLGARDTLRLEAGLNLYGQDMDESVTPLEANIAWTVAFEPESREFLGRVALQKMRDDMTHSKLYGLVLIDRGVLRPGLKVFYNDELVGETTSGTFSPTLQKGIAMARLDQALDVCEVEVRGKRLSARVVKLPFVRRGKILVTI